MENEDAGDRLLDMWALCSSSVVYQERAGLPPEKFQRHQKNPQACPCQVPSGWLELSYSCFILHIFYIFFRNPEFYSMGNRSLRKTGGWSQVER